MEQYKDVDKKYYPIIENMIKSIDEVYKIQYWNKYQKEALGFTTNSGEIVETDMFKARAYYWGDDEEEMDKPNFEYKGLKIFWYKYIGRCTDIIANTTIDMDFLSEMYKDCTNSLRQGFKTND